MMFMLMIAALSVSAAPIEPPPGWADATKDAASRGALVALKGPQTSSFIVKSATVALDNPAAVRGYLNDVLSGMRQASRLDYKSSGRLETRVFRNGLKVQLLRASLDGHERLILGVLESGGEARLAVLRSAAPDAMIESVFDALPLGELEGAVQTSGIARSSDGQLEIELGGGLRARSLLGPETAKHFVLAIQGSGSEVRFQKLSEADATKPAEQAAIVRELAAASAKVPRAESSPVKEAATAAGPVGVYATARGTIAVGYLPWGYWGYQLFARGPEAEDLLVGALAALKPGSTAVPGLLSATPRIPLGDESSSNLIGLGVAAALIAIVVLWSRSRKSANVAP